MSINELAPVTKEFTNTTSPKELARLLADGWHIYAQGPVHSNRLFTKTYTTLWRHL